MRSSCESERKECIHLPSAGVPIGRAFFARPIAKVTSTHVRCVRACVIHFTHTHRTCTCTINIYTRSCNEHGLVLVAHAYAYRCAYLILPGSTCGMKMRCGGAIISIGVRSTGGSIVCMRNLYIYIYIYGKSCISPPHPLSLKRHTVSVQIGPCAPCGTEIYTNTHAHCTHARTRARPFCMRRPGTPAGRPCARS